MLVKNNWHKDFFDNSFYNPASREAVAQAKKETDFLLKAFRLQKKSKILDVCCGPGRHSIVLARKGFAVTGADITQEYLRQARQSARKAGVKAKFIRADMRKLPYKKNFEAAICMFTSFGYFADDTDNLRALVSIARALKPGGKFIIDVLDKQWFEKNLQGKRWSETEDGGFLLEETEYDKKSALAKTRWIVLRPGSKPAERKFMLKMYDKKSMHAILRRAGLKPLKTWNTLSMSRTQEPRNRLVVLAEK